MASDRTTDWETVTRVGERTTSLSFAVLLVDPVTGRRPSGDVSVSLETSSVDPVENPSGFQLFLDLATDPVTLVVDGGDRYFDERRTVYHDESPPSDAAGLEVSDPGDPVVIPLTPTPAYQFTAGTTRIRGTVTDGTDDTPVAGARVSLEGFDMVARTTDAGEYALYVPATAENVVRDDGDQFVKVQGSDSDSGDSGEPEDSSADDGGQPGNNQPSGNGSPGNGTPGNGTPGNGSPTNDNSPPPDPELTVRHPDYSTWAQRVTVEGGELTTHDVELQP